MTKEILLRINECGDVVHALFSEGLNIQQLEGFKVWADARIRDQRAMAPKTYAGEQSMKELKRPIRCKLCGFVSTVETSNPIKGGHFSVQKRGSFRAIPCEAEYPKDWEEETVANDETVRK